MSRRKTIRLDQFSLNQRGTTTRHPFQCIAVKELIEKHWWRVSSVNYHNDVTVVVVRMISDSQIGAAVYPNGSFGRSKSPKITWDWKRAIDLATATLPDPYVQNIIDTQHLGD